MVYLRREFIKVKIYGLETYSFSVYAEMGYASGDTETVTITYGATSPAKLFNIFVQQIECTNPSR